VPQRGVISGKNRQKFKTTGRRNTEMLRNEGNKKWTYFQAMRTVLKIFS